MPRPKSKEKGQAMLEAAKDLFLENSYTDVSMTNIGDIAGISKSTLYCHYPDKAALFMAVVKNYWRKGLLPKIDPKDSREMSVVLKEFSHKLITFLYRKDTVPFFKTIITESSRFSELAGAIAANRTGPFVKGLKEYFATTHGKSPEAADRAARYFLSLLFEDVFWRVFAGLRKPYGEEELEVYINNLVDFYVRAVEVL